MTESPSQPGAEAAHKAAPSFEQSLPFFWPVSAALNLEEDAFRIFGDNLDFLAEAEKLNDPKPPTWATSNKMRLDMDTMRLLDFSDAAAGAATPVLIDAPYAGHRSTIADYDKGQSLVETLMNSGLRRVCVTDWKPATPEMRDFDIDKYLAELNVAIDELGGQVHLVGLCQGGWLSAMLAARFPHKVKTLVLAGSPIDTDAGDGPIKHMAHALPFQTYQKMVELGGGLMPGRFMLAGWKNMHPKAQYLEKYADLYRNIEDKSYIVRTEKFERWYENPLDLPGRYYLQAIKDLFKDNLFAKGRFKGLGRLLNLKDVTCPTYLLAGEADDITTREQVFAAEHLIGTPPQNIVRRLVPGGHIGLFMGSRTLKEVWPDIASWIISYD
ncbi:MAG: alpha/beta fold hydrolase [Asticcacaulis sp.]|uniref:alpha/beta fold hydrolase n=1 Tax=Asticcacaulis sp. TaxID=1872648 RepID=UPI003F7B6A68